MEIKPLSDREIRQAEAADLGVLRDSGGASGEDLRELALHGKDKALRERLRAVANTCSVDDLGLSSLHYGQL
jgi:hypothetical protein